MGSAHLFRKHRQHPDDLYRSASQICPRRRLRQGTSTQSAEGSPAGCCRLFCGPEEFVRTKSKWQGARKRRHFASPHFHGRSLESHNQPFSETTPYMPNSPYAASKAASDRLVRAHFHTSSLYTEAAYSLPSLRGYTIRSLTCRDSDGRFRLQRTSWKRRPN
jgi:GDP-D-mannose dehydratase